jgi:hypothetical protein
MWRDMVLGVGGFGFRGEWMSNDSFDGVTGFLLENFSCPRDSFHWSLVSSTEALDRWNKVLIYKFLASRDACVKKYCG